MDNPLFLKAKVITPLPQTETEAHAGATQRFSQTEINRILVFRHIEKTQPTTRYKIAKETRLGYTAVRLIVRDLVFAGIVHEEIKPHDNGKQYKILTIPITCCNKLTQRSMVETPASPICKINEECEDEE